MNFRHWVFRAEHPHQPFKSFEDASDFWPRLKASFTDALALILMPNHAHLLLPASLDPELAKNKLHALMNQCSRRINSKITWQKLSAPTEIWDRFHLKRQLRYVALNPCRKNLCTDPLEWRWSTYRELFDGSHRYTAIANLIREPSLKAYHQYVSSDPSVSITGTPPPLKKSLRNCELASLEGILASVVAATGKHPRAIQTKRPPRLLFVQACEQLGWTKTQIIADLCDISTRGLRRLRHLPASSELQHVFACLSDPRLSVAANQVTQDFINQVRSSKQTEQRRKVGRLSEDSSSTPHPYSQ